MNKKYAVFGLAAALAIIGVIYFGIGANQQASVAALDTNNVVTPIGPITTNPNDPGWTKLCKDGKAHVQVLSPNGGETYQGGQQITVKWRSCNVQNFPGTNTSRVGVLLKQQSTGVRYTLIPNVNPQYGNSTENDGSEIVLLPTSSTYPVTPISYGKDFRVIVVLADPYPPIESPNRVPIFDDSNSLFTINNNSQQVDLCTNIPGVQTTVPVDMTATNGVCTSTTDNWTATCADGKPHIQVLSPNGGEVYQAGQQVNVKWRSCFSNRFPGGTGDDTARITLISSQRDTAINVLIDHISEGPHAAVVTLPANFPPYISGTFYKMKVDYIDNLPPSPTSGQLLATDYSDNLFTLKAK